LQSNAIPALKRRAIFTLSLRDRANAERPNWNETTGESAAILDCGGKRSATPLWPGVWKPLSASCRAKAPSSLRFAGAVQDVLLKFVCPNFISLFFAVLVRE